MTVLIILLNGCTGKDKYAPGTEISYHDASWYILDKTDDYYVLLSKEQIVPESIFFEDDLLFDTIRYFNGPKLKYNDSALYLYFQEEIEPLYEDLVEVNGYKARLLSIDDIRKIIPLEKKTDDNGIIYYAQSDNRDYSWIIEKGKWYWLMSEASDDIANVVYGESASEKYLHYCWYTITCDDKITITSVGNHMDDSIKMVINVKKEAIEK